MRPTREQVDAALARFERQKYDAESIELVAGELLALREELSEAHNSFHDADQAAIARSAEIDALREQLAEQVAFCKALQESQERLAVMIRGRPAHEHAITHLAKALQPFEEAMGPTREHVDEALQQHDGDELVDTTRQHRALCQLVLKYKQVFKDPEASMSETYAARETLFDAVAELGNADERSLPNRALRS